MPNLTVEIHDIPKELAEMLYLRLTENEELIHTGPTFSGEVYNADTLSATATRKLIEKKGIVTLHLEPRERAQ